jgi:hypothetical protein
MNMWWFLWFSWPICRAPRGRRCVSSGTAYEEFGFEGRPELIKPETKTYDNRF